ncbi:MAG: hypothetical protein MHMPM18_004868 [Marteilia pararefringens]
MVEGNKLASGLSLALLLVSSKRFVSGGSHCSKILPLRCSRSTRFLPNFQTHTPQISKCFLRSSSGHNKGNRSKLGSGGSKNRSDKKEFEEDRNNNNDDDNDHHHDGDDFEFEKVQLPRIEEMQIELDSLRSGLMTQLECCLPNACLLGDFLIHPLIHLLFH